MGGDQELRRGQQSMQGDVLIPETGAGRYWYVDPRAGAPSQPAAQLAQQASAPYDPMADERSNQAQLAQWDAQGPTQSSGAGIADAIRRMFSADQSDLTYRPSSSQTTYDPMDDVRRRAAYKEQVDQMYHVMGPKDVEKTISMEIGGKEWEVPAVFDNMTDRERDIISYLPHTQWPKDILDKIENTARDNLEQGNDPFGNSFRPPQMGF